MGLASRLYQRFRVLIHEFAKFGVVGGIGFFVTWAGFNLFRFGAGLGLLTSNTLATIPAMFVTFLGNRYWSFRHREAQGTGRETVLFVIFNAIGILIQYGCTWADKNVLGLDDKLSTNIAFLFGIALGTLFRFATYRQFVWVAPTAPVEPSGAELNGYPARQPAMVPAPPGSPAASRAAWARRSGPPYGAVGPGGTRPNGRPRPTGPRHARTR